MDVTTTPTAQSEERPTAAVGEQVRLVTIAAAAQLLGVSRSKLCELLAEGALPMVRIGRSRMDGAGPLGDGPQARDLRFHPALLTWRPEP